MQELTLILHVVSIVFAIWIYIYRGTWKYFAVMLGLFNLIGIFYYWGVGISGGAYGHTFSRVRSMLQVLMWLIFAISLAFNRRAGDR